MATKTTAERLAVMETKVEIIDTKVDALHMKLDVFVESANLKYAEKCRVDDIERKVNAHETKFAYYAGAIGIVFLIIQLGLKLLFGGS